MPGPSICDSCVHFIKELREATRIVRRKSPSFSLIWEDGDVNQFSPVGLRARVRAIDAGSRNGKPANKSAMGHIHVFVSQDIPSIDYPVSQRSTYATIDDAQSRMSPAAVTNGHDRLNRPNASRRCRSCRTHNDAG